MKLLLKQRFFSWFDSYDVYYEDGSVAFKVKGEPAWGHLLRILMPRAVILPQLKKKYLLLCRSLKYFTGMNMWEIFIKN